MVPGEIFDDLLILAVQNGACEMVIGSDKVGLSRKNGGQEEVDMPPIDGEEALAFVEESLPSNFREVWDIEE